MAPTDVIRAILRAPVDLLWNGGIGTVVKASDETDADAMDRASDAIRVDAADLRCRVIGEGGNLGVTRRGRVEFAREGGLINADFIDNSAGVDCSDHEVNLKILLGLAERRGELDRPARDELLLEVTDDVVEHVLYDSFLQAQILSQEVVVSKGRMYAYEDLMVALESTGLLARESERLPGTEEIAERRRGGRGLERPELALLLAYAKQARRARPAGVGLLRGPLARARPARLLPGPRRRALRPPARRASAAARADRDGQREPGRQLARPDVRLPARGRARRRRGRRDARLPDRARGHGRRRALGRRREPAARHRPARRHRADARRRPAHGGDHALVPGPRRRAGSRSRSSAAAAPFAKLVAALPEIGSDEWRAHRRQVADDLVAQGVPEDLAWAHALTAELMQAPDIISIAGQTGRTVEEVAQRIPRARRAARHRLAARRARRAAPDHAHPALGRAGGARGLPRRAGRARPAAPCVEAAEGQDTDAAVDAYLEARAALSRRLAAVTASLTVEGTGDLPALMLAVRAVRALAA